MLVPLDGGSLSSRGGEERAVSSGPLNVKHLPLTFGGCLPPTWAQLYSDIRHHYPAVRRGSVVSLCAKVTLSLPRRPRRPSARTSGRPGRASSAAAASFLVQLDDVVQRHAHFVRQRSHVSPERDTLKNTKLFCVKLLSPVAP